MQLNDQTNVPLKYLISMIAFCISVLGTTFYMGMVVQGIDSRLMAEETHSREVDDELRYRLQIRQDFLKEMQAMRNDIAEIKGILNEMRRRR